MYVVITVTEEGNVLLSLSTRDDVEGRMKADYWGSEPNYVSADELRGNIESFVDLYEFEGDPPHVIIIEGKVITPVVVEKVVRYGLPEPSQGE